jgi:hypothetical protein
LASPASCATAAPVSLSPSSTSSAARRYGADPVLLPLVDSIRRLLCLINR